MEAVILAGGFGTRLRSVVSDVPKPMAPVAGRPFLELLLRSLSDKGCKHAILSVGFLAETIIEHFGKRFANLDLTYAVETSPLGTGGGLRAALQFASDDSVLVLNGDTFLDLELSELLSRWEATHCPQLVARQVPDTSRFGRLTLAGDRVVGFAEKGTGGPGIVNAGTYLFPRNVVKLFPERDPFSLETDFLVPNLAVLQLECFVSTGYFIDIGVPEDFERAQSELREFVQ